VIVKDFPCSAFPLGIVISPRGPRALAIWARD
jgi:hypothetical protein